MTGIGRLIVGLLVLLPSFAGAASAVATDVVRERGATTTRVVLKIDRCAHCVVRLGNTTAPDYRDWWSSERERVGHDGRVAISVPRRHTAGLYAAMTSARWTALNAEVLVVMRFGGKEVGQRVGARQAAKARRASPCWAGSERSRATWAIRVASYRAVGVDGTRGRAFRAWVPRTKVWLPPMLRIRGGSLGTQESVSCDTR